MMKQTRCYGCDKPIEPEWLPVGEFIVCDECSSDTDELSVEKLQEQLNTAKKALTEISKTKDFYRSGCDHWEEFSQDALKAQKALAEIGGDDE
ncbi:hypothetical protein KGN15_004010 [Lactococcus lactis]|uniref:hypothetical protein n=1 Tax=Lactococcus lactis TaxID=1358 RepID=UPI001C200790|nr:hypothetical protein [Lactococcus lactis]MBU7533438.1 hypothetical protein [Lactococcus lactis]WOF40660.1 hypothetical protein N4R43_01530 [Lactococcus lactis]